MVCFRHLNIALSSISGSVNFETSQTARYPYTFQSPFFCVSIRARSFFLSAWPDNREQPKIHHLTQNISHDTIRKITNPIAPTWEEIKTWSLELDSPFSSTPHAYRSNCYLSRNFWAQSSSIWPLVLMCMVKMVFLCCHYSASTQPTTKSSAGQCTILWGIGQITAVGKEFGSQPKRTEGNAVRVALAHRWDHSSDQNQVFVSNLGATLSTPFLSVTHWKGA